MGVKFDVFLNAIKTLISGSIYRPPSVGNTYELLFVVNFSPLKFCG